MTNNILQTKLHIPSLRSSFVPRQRLTARLNSEQDARLILVSAPAGYGKTTLVTEWLSSVSQSAPIGPPPRESSRMGVAWLSLDENDNDPRRFLVYLLAAFRQVNAAIGQAAGAMLQAPQLPPDDVLMTSLVNEIAAVAQPFFLILDDYHVIHAPPIYKQVNFLLEHQPAHMRMVVITREDPPLPLARLRARGQLVEIRQQDLRFTQDECADFLNQVMGLDLRFADIAALERRTEGWIAGLQLAALSMRGRFDRAGFIDAFTGSSHYVLDYLIEEVFQQQSSDVQDFLMRTSILERLSGPLCDAVANRTASRELLEHLEHANLFIVPLDQSCTWYRYHRLFADLLHQRLKSAGKFPELELHRLASQWFQVEGYYPEAIQHALAAADWERAADLIGGQSVVMLRSGELMSLLGWFKSLPSEVIRARPLLCRDYGWALTLTGQFDAAIPILECAERAFQCNDTQLGQVMVAQAYLARARGDNLRAIALSRQALGLVLDTDVLHRGLVMFTLGFALLGANQFAEAESVLIEACESTRASGNDYARLTALGLLGVIQKNQGRLHRAAEFCRQAMQEAHDSPVVAQTQVFLASILYEWNDLDAAIEQLEGALKAGRYIGNRATEPEIYRILAHVKLARGDSASALELLNELQQSAHEFESPLARAIIATFQADMALGQGDITSATHWAQKMTEGIEPAALGLSVGLIQSRLALAQDKPTEAGMILAGMYESVSKMGMVASMIDIRAMQAIAATTPEDALGYLSEALKMAQPEGFIRTFVDKGEPMRVLLERLKSQGRELKPYVLTLLAALGETNPSAGSRSPVEQISEREIEILHLLADGFSNQEIADKLVIGIGTAKSHVHHILEKLGGNNRTQAVAKARELGLLK